MRVLLVSSGHLEAEALEALRSTLLDLGCAVRAVTGARVVLNTTRQAVSFRPDVALLLGLSVGPAVVLAALHIPYVVWVGTDLSRSGLDSMPVAKRTVLQQAAAVAVDRWSDARALAKQAGALKAVEVSTGVRLDQQPIGPRTEALAALGLPADRQLAGIITDLGPKSRIDLLLDAYRSMPGVGLLVSGEGPQLDRVRAMQMTARPSAPVIPVGPRGPATDLLVACAATVGIDLEVPGPGDGARAFLAQGRRVVTTAGEDATALLDLYSPALRAVHVIRPSGAALREGLAAALDAETDLGPVPDADVDRARHRLARESWPARMIDVLTACR